jgi:hypothetical protein
MFRRFDANQISSSQRLGRRMPVCIVVNQQTLVGRPFIVRWLSDCPSQIARADRIFFQLAGMARLNASDR